MITHIINPCNAQITIEGVDEPGPSGTNYCYVVRGVDSKPPFKSCGRIVVSFQNGPVSECGVNGIAQEVLLAIVADRLRTFQAGPYACRENDMALARIEEAQHWLQQRTLARIRRGAEGTHEK